MRNKNRTSNNDAYGLVPVDYLLDYTIDIDNGILISNAEVTILNTSKERVENIDVLINKGLRVTSCNHYFNQHIRPINIPFNNKKLLINHVEIRPISPLKPGSMIKVKLTYHGRIEGYQEVFPYIKDRISREYTLLRPDSFSYPIISKPDFNILISGLPRQRFTYTLIVRVPNNYVPATHGELLSESTEGSWHLYVFREKTSTWRIDLAVSRFRRVIDPEHSIIIYVFPEDINYAYKLIRNIVKAYKLYSQLLGNPFEWRGYTVIEIPDDWGGQACETGALLPRKSIREEGGESIIYHEIAHLWNVKSGEDSPSRFLDEGIATYLQLIAEKEILNRDINGRLDLLLRKFKKLAEKEKKLTKIPVSDYGKHGLTDASYLIGPIILYILEKIVDKVCYWNSLKIFIEKYSRKPANLWDFSRTFKEVCGEKAGILAEELLFTPRIAEILVKASSTAEVVEAFRRIYDV